MSTLPRRAFLAGLAAAPLPILSADASPGHSAISPEAQRIVDLEKPYAVAVTKLTKMHSDDPDYAAAEVPVKAIEAEFEGLRDLIWSRPVRSFSDVVDRAVVARWAAVEVNIDGSWCDLSLGKYESAHAEATLAVLMLAGLTDGKVERDGGLVVTEHRAEPFKVTVRDDTNAPVLLPGMCLEVYPYVQPMPGDLVVAFPQRGGPDHMIGRYETRETAGGVLWRVAAINPEHDTPERWFDDTFRVAGVVLYERRIVGDMLVRGRIRTGAASI